jgi:serine/threonine protein kinase
MVDIDDRVTEDVERRFFPAGTAEKVLTSEALTRLFTTISSTERASNLRLQPAVLARLVETRKLHAFLAILVTSNCDLDGFSAFTTNLLAPDQWSNPGGDIQLPTEDGNRLQDILEDDVAADNFLQKQHEFFAAVIEKNKEVKGRFRRLPYVREKLIGQGSFGKIYDVSVRLLSLSRLTQGVVMQKNIPLPSVTDFMRLQISPHHFKSGPMLNDEEYRIARKDFELNAEDKSHEKERDVLRDIVRNAKPHNNIMKSLGSLDNGSIYSLFMPLAYCDLKEYMQRNPAAPSLPQQKSSFVHCAVGLAGAIAYLHEDLKPQNILVVIDPESKEPSWKLSDFNMSRVKMKRKPLVDQLPLRRSSTFSDNVYEINKLFKRRIPDSASASAADYTVGRRGTGTYLAPEACVDGHPVQAESDTWSLGCVISVVFSYLYGGQAAVEEYSELRGKKDDVDRFFSFSGGNSQHRLSDAHVSEAVKNWHKHLRMKTRQERPDESEAFEALLNFLDRRVLVIDPKSRRETTAKDIRSKLIDAFDVFHNLEERGPTSPVSPRSRFKIPILKRWRRQSEAEAQSQDWKIQLPAAVKTCAFGPNAEPLVCMTDSTLTVCSLEHVLLLDASCNFNKNLIVYGEVSPQDEWRHWIPNIGVSSRYIVAATDHKEFDVSFWRAFFVDPAYILQCYFYQITQPGNHNSEVKLVAHWELRMPRIQKVAISPDARYVAFVLFGGPTRKEKCTLFITKLDLQYYADQERYVSAD